MKKKRSTTVGPYRLEKLLGIGGMGRIHLAHDQRLDRKVAIKHIKPEAAEDPACRLRLLREARAIARLSHPAIVRIFDILEVEDGDRIVMEFVDGPTIAELLKEGPLAISVALSLAQEVTGGLAEAHDAGILHRDLKSENVMIGPGNRAKILDFGLVKRLDNPDGELSLSLRGELLGTCRSMSPEQAKGLELDHRSDLFSLGTLLYEMTTGESPFLAPTTLATLNRVCSHQQTPAHKLNPAVPYQLSQLIDRLLRKEPEKRPASAHEVAEELAEIAFTYRARPSSRPALIGVLTSRAGELLPNRRSMRCSWRVAAVALFAFLVTGAWSPPKEALAELEAMPKWQSVALLPFTNLSQDTEQDWLSTAIPSMLNGGELALGNQFHIVSDETVNLSLRELPLLNIDTLSLPTLKRLDKLLGGADLIVSGSFLASSQQLRVKVIVQETGSGGTVDQFFETGSDDHIFDLIDRISSTLSEGLGLDVPMVTEHDWDTRPKSQEAARLYFEGRRQLSRLNFKAASQYFNKVIDIQPDYPLAYAGLAEALSALGDDRRARESAATAKTLANELWPPEQKLIAGYLAEMNKDWDQAIDIYRELLDSRPDDVESLLRYTNALTQAGRGRETIAVIEKWRQKATAFRAAFKGVNDVRLYIAEAQAAYSFSDYQRVRKDASLAAQRGERIGAKALVARARLLDGNALVRLGELSQASAVLSSAQRLAAEVGDPRLAAEASNRLANIAYERGDFRQARQVFEELLRAVSEIGYQTGIALAHNNIASALLREGQFAAAEPHLDEALVVARNAGSSSAEGFVLTSQAHLYWRQGKLAEAREKIEQARTLTQEMGCPYPFASSFYTLGNILLSSGNLAAARAVLEEGLTVSGKDKALTAHLHASLGDLARESSDFTAARGQYEKALALWHEIQSPVMTFEVRLALAQLTIEEGDPESTFSTLRDAVEFFRQRQLTHQELYASTLLIAAELERGRDQLDDVRPQLAHAEKLLAHSEDVALRVWTYVQLARARAALDETRAALTSLAFAEREASKRGLALAALKARRELELVAKAAEERQLAAIDTQPELP